MNLLFEKLPIECIELSNRICFLAHRTNFGRQGRLNDRHITYYQRRARGGCGLITITPLHALYGEKRTFYETVNYESERKIFRIG